MKNVKSIDDIRKGNDLIRKRKRELERNIENLTPYIN